MRERWILGQSNEESPPKNKKTVKRSMVYIAYRKPLSNLDTTRCKSTDNQKYLDTHMMYKIGMTRGVGDKRFHRFAHLIAKVMTKHLVIEYIVIPGDARMIEWAFFEKFGDKCMTIDGLHTGEWAFCGANSSVVKVKAFLLEEVKKRYHGDFSFTQWIANKKNRVAEGSLRRGQSIDLLNT
jgi:hypothetical protein